MKQYRFTAQARVEVELMARILEAMNNMFESRGRKLDALSQAQESIARMLGAMDVIDAEAEAVDSALKRAEGELRART